MGLHCFYKLVFSIHHGKQRKEKFLNGKRILRLDVNSGKDFVLCVSLFFLEAVSIFFFSILLVKYFSVEQKQSRFVTLEAFCKKGVLKHLCGSSFFQWSCRIENCNFIKNRLRQSCFLINFTKKLFRKSTPL